MSAKKLGKIKKSRQSAPVLPSVKLYRRIAAGFLILTIAMLSIVLYLATVRATIIVETQEEPVEREFIARVMSEPQSSEDIPARIFSELIERSKTFEVSADGERIPAKANGLVTIVNESGSAQPLVATTRLLSEGGVLFRLKSGVTVPANGEVQAEAEADEVGEDGEIEATTFTIPGLNETRQKQIYATSDQKMVGGTIVKKVLDLADLDGAHAEFLEELKTEMDEKWRSEITAQLDGATMLTETVEKRSGVEPGAETGTFDISTIVRITGIYYDSARLRQIAELKLREHVSDGRVLDSVNYDEMVIVYNRHDVMSQIAHFDVTVSGVALLKTTADILDKTNIIGLTAAEAEEFLEGHETIRNVDIELSPFWVRRIPRLQDHVTIEIRQTEGL